jgi:hypothetical protein
VLVVDQEEYVVERMKDRRRDHVREWGDTNPLESEQQSGRQQQGRPINRVHCNVNEMNSQWIIFLDAPTYLDKILVGSQKKNSVLYLVKF